MEVGMRNPFKRKKKPVDSGHERVLNKVNQYYRNEPVQSQSLLTDPLMQTILLNEILTDNTQYVDSGDTNCAPISDTGSSDYSSPSCDSSSYDSGYSSDSSSYDSGSSSYSSYDS